MPILKIKRARKSDYFLMSESRFSGGGAISRDVQATRSDQFIFKPLDMDHEELKDTKKALQTWAQKQ